MRKSSKGYAKVVQRLCESRPKIMQQSSKGYAKAVQRLCKRRPTVMRKSPKGYAKVIQRLKDSKLIKRKTAALMERKATALTGKYLAYKAEIKSLVADGAKKKKMEKVEVKQLNKLNTECPQNLTPRRRKKALQSLRNAKSYGNKKNGITTPRPPTSDSKQNIRRRAIRLGPENGGSRVLSPTEEGKINSDVKAKMWNHRSMYVKGERKKYVKKERELRMQGKAELRLTPRLISTACSEPSKLIAKNYRVRKATVQGGARSRGPKRHIVKVIKFTKKQLFPPKKRTRKMSAKDLEHRYHYQCHYWYKEKLRAVCAGYVEECSENGTLAEKTGEARRRVNIRNGMMKNGWAQKKRVSTSICKRSNKEELHAALLYHEKKVKQTEYEAVKQWEEDYVFRHPTLPITINPTSFPSFPNKVAEWAAYDASCLNQLMTRGHSYRPSKLEAIPGTIRYGSSMRLLGDDDTEMDMKIPRVVCHPAYFKWLAHARQECRPPRKRQARNWNTNSSSFSSLRHAPTKENLQGEVAYKF